MKHLYRFWLLSLTIGANAQIIDFPDPLFKARLLTSNPIVNPVAFDQDYNYVLIDANSDGEITQQEALAVYKMSLGAGDIVDVTGIEYFTNLTWLDISDNLLTSLDVSSLTNLKRLSCNWTPVTTITLNDQLEELTCLMDEIETLDVSHCPNLRKLSCSHNHISELDVAGLNLLETLYCSNNEISVLNVSNMPQLNSLDCANNNVSELDVAGKSLLSELDFSNNQLTTIDLTGVGTDTDPDTWFFLTCDYNNLSTLDISVMENDYIICNVNFNPNLTSIYAYNNILFFDAIWNEPPLPGPSLYFQGTPNLEYICVYPMNIEYVQQKIANYAYTGVTVNSLCGEQLGVENASASTINLYPNPVANMLFIDGRTFDHTTVYNMLGQPVLNIDEVGNSINVSSLPSGNYFIRIWYANESATAKFIKQ
jgi:hypothetical protein